MFFRGITKGLGKNNNLFSILQKSSFGYTLSTHAYKTPQQDVVQNQLLYLLLFILTIHCTFIRWKFSSRYTNTIIVNVKISQKPYIICITTFFSFYGKIHCERSIRVSIFVQTTKVYNMISLPVLFVQNVYGKVSLFWEEDGILYYKKCL